MNQDQIIQWAREAGFVTGSVNGIDPDEVVTSVQFITDELTRFASIVRSAALDEAADIVDNADTPDCGGWTASGIADAIRALKGTT